MHGTTVEINDSTGERVNKTNINLRPMAMIKANQPVKRESAWKETCKGAAMIRSVVNTI